MTTGSTNTPRAAASQGPRIMNRLGAVCLLALALLFVRPCQMPGSRRASPFRLASGAGRAQAPAFTVATLLSREPGTGPPLAGRSHLDLEFPPPLDLAHGSPL